MKAEVLTHVFTCSPGLWKIVAKFQSNPQQSFTAEFEVKEYGIAFTVCWEMLGKLQQASPDEDLCFSICSSAEF